MTQLTANFELGVNGNNVQTTDAGSANAWDTISRGGSTTIQYDNTHKYGTLAAKFNAVTASAHYCQWQASLGTVVNHYGRLYLWIDAIPTAEHFWLAALNAAGTVLCGRYAINTSGKIRLQNSAGGTAATGTVTVATGQWVRLEYMMLNSLTVGQMEVKLFNSPESSTPTETITSAANLNTRADTDTLRLGAEQAVTAGYIHWLDNIVGGASDYPGPVPPALISPSPLRLGKGSAW